MRAPEPTAGQSILSYRQETDRLLKRLCLPQNHEFYKIQWRGLDTDVLDGLEPQHFKECEKQFNDPNNLPDGQIKMVPRMDAFGRVTHYDAIGRRSFVADMQRRGRRVISFWAPTDLSGRPLGRVTTRG